MKTCAKKMLFIGCIAAILIIGTGLPASSNGWFTSELEYVECGPDGNEAHVNATILKKTSRIYDAVCATDPFDWYLLPLPGDVTWEGRILCIADSPGLALKFYLDSGSGPEFIREASPVLTSWGGGESYILEWDILDLAADAGLSAGPAGNYYIRVGYYSAYPGEHAYMLNLYMFPVGFTPSPFNSAVTARPLPPGIIHHGHLDVSDPSDWFSFEIAPGQAGTGLIFANKMRRGPVIIDTGPENGNGMLLILMHNFQINLRASDLSLITTILPGASPGFIELGGPANLSPGTYYIEARISGPSPPPDMEMFYMVFNHALAPDSGPWGPDFNIDHSSAVAFAEASPIIGTVYWPRDREDYFSFSSPGYFLGDIFVEPSLDATALRFLIEGDGESYYYCTWLPGLGVTCRYNPVKAGSYYLVVRDKENLLIPTDYILTYYQHGPPMTGPMGHNTWETAFQIEPVITPEGYYYGNPDVVIDFQPGVQNVFFGVLTVPVDQYLVGYYDIYGSRNDYRVRLGQIGPGGTPVWSPALSPNSRGKLTLDMSYEYLTDAGTYYLKVEMLPSSAGRMRVLIDNHTRITECATDDNNAYNEAASLKASYSGTSYKQAGEFCPPLDTVDWYYFDSGSFDITEGPKQNLALHGGADGMRVELYELFGKCFISRGDAEVTEVGGWAVIDLDGAIEPNKVYYVKVIADTTEERVQVYELFLQKDLILAHPFIRLYGYERFQFLPQIVQPFRKEKGRRIK